MKATWPAAPMSSSRIVRDFPFWAFFHVNLARHLIQGLHVTHLFRRCQLLYFYYYPYSSNMRMKLNNPNLQLDFTPEKLTLWIHPLQRHGHGSSEPKGKAAGIEAQRTSTAVGDRDNRCLTGAVRRQSWRRNRISCGS